MSSFSGHTFVCFFVAALRSIVLRYMHAPGQPHVQLLPINNLHHFLFLWKWRFFRVFFVRALYHLVDMKEVF